MTSNQSAAAPMRVVKRIVDFPIFRQVFFSEAFASRSVVVVTMVHPGHFVFAEEMA